jgi:hypothetical protein
MAKFRLREVVRLNGNQHTVEQIAEDPGSEPRYWLQRGKDFESRVWVKEHEIENPGARDAMAAQFMREQVAQRLSTRPLKPAPVSTENTVIRPEGMWPSL